MLYFSDSLLDQLLLEDINQGDLTTRSLGIQNQTGSITYTIRKKGRASGIKIACRILEKLGLEIISQAEDGQALEPGSVLLIARGQCGRLHQGWKVAQNVLEWSCGVTATMAEMLAKARAVNPGVAIACTRKSIPGTKLLAQEAILHGGGVLHRGGTAETILLFANHRRFWADPLDWKGQIDRLRANAPEKKVLVEADTFEEAIAALEAGTDVLQLDKFLPDTIQQVMHLARQKHSRCLVIAAGGINTETVRDYAATGVSLLVSSAPYYAKPADIKVFLAPLKN